MQRALVNDSRAATRKRKKDKKKKKKKKTRTVRSGAGTQRGHADNDRRGREVARAVSRGKEVPRQQAAPRASPLQESTSQNASRGEVSREDVARKEVARKKAGVGKIDPKNSQRMTFDSSESESESADAMNSTTGYGCNAESSPQFPSHREQKTKKKRPPPQKLSPVRKKSRAKPAKPISEASPTSSESSASSSSSDSAASDEERDEHDLEGTSSSPRRDSDVENSEFMNFESMNANASNSDASSSNALNSDASNSDALSSDSSSSDSSSSDDDEVLDQDDPDDEADENTNPNRKEDPEWVTTPGGDDPVWWKDEIEEWLEDTRTMSGQKKSARRLKRSIHFLIVFLKNHYPKAHRLKKVKPKHLRAWIRQLEEQIRSDREEERLRQEQERLRQGKPKSGKSKNDTPVEYTMSDNVKRAHMIAIKSFWASLVNNLSVKINVSMPLKLPPKPPAKNKVKDTNEETRAMFLEEAKRNGTVHASIVGLLFFAGLRVRELVCLLKTDVSLTKEDGKKNIHVVVRKEGAKYEKKREFDLGKKGVKYLWPYLKQLRRMNGKSNKYLFPARWTAKTKGRGHRSTDSVYRMIKHKYSEKLGTKHTPHWLRHAFATLLSRKGQGEKEIQAFLGHESVKTTRGYIHADTNAGMLE